MFKTTQTKTRLFFACIAMTLFATGVRADTSVTVNDSFAPHGAYLRWDKFSTDMTAAVQNPPKTNEETTIAGPTYSWSVVSQNPSSPLFSITDSGGGNATLSSATPSKTVNFVAGGGTYTVTVKCVIGYTSKDVKTGEVTPLSYPGTLDITFFVRVPVKVLSYNQSQPLPIRGTKLDFYDGGLSPAPAYGQATGFSMEVYDNQTPKAPYGNGVIVEDFSRAFDNTGHSVDPNGPDGGSSWRLHYDDGTGSPTDNFLDGSAAYQRQPRTDYTSLAETHDQIWHCMELTPPYNAQGSNLYVEPGKWGPSPDKLGNPPPSSYLPNVNNTTLNTQSLSVYFDHSVRK